MLGFVIILCVSLAQAERLGQNYGQGGYNNGFDHRFRNRVKLVPTPATPAFNINPVKAEMKNERNSFDPALSGKYAGPVEGSYNKEFYTYSAPEEDIKDIEVAQHLALTAPKNLRVVFIKAPENNAFTNAALQLARKNAESKTAIYVLTKQPDIAALANNLQSVQPTQESKPEVHFIKYRTPEDADRAQEIIKNEYDSLGGTSRASHEGLAHVLDFYSHTEQLPAGNNINDINFPGNSNAGLLVNK